VTIDSSATPGGSEVDGQAPEPGSGEAQDTPSTGDDQALKNQITALRQEAAKHRRERNEARERLAAIEAEKAQAEASRLEKQGEWQALAEQRAQEMTQIQAAAAATQAALEQRIIDTTLRGKLISAGIEDADLQELILPGLRSQAKLTKDKEVTGKYADAIAKAAAKFAPKQPDPPAEPEPDPPRQRTAYDIVASQLPGSQTPPSAMSAHDRTLARLNEASGD
jgi:hypothetical protein